MTLDPKYPLLQEPHHRCPMRSIDQWDTVGGDLKHKEDMEDSQIGVLQIGQVFKILIEITGNLKIYRMTIGITKIAWGQMTAGWRIDLLEVHRRGSKMLLIGEVSHHGLSRRVGSCGTQRGMLYSSRF